MYLLRETAAELLGLRFWITSNRLGPEMAEETSGMELAGCGGRNGLAGSNNNAQ